MKSKTPVNGLPPIHPGEFLRETLDELGLTQAALAEAIGVSPMRVSHVLKGDRPVTAELALRLGRAPGRKREIPLGSFLKCSASSFAEKARVRVPTSLAIRK